MLGKYFSKGKKEDFYLPGEEIKIGKSIRNYTRERDPLSTCKNRLALAAMGFLAVYLVLTVRLFDVCISGDYVARREDAQAAQIKIMTSNPIKRADILDRNGTILATSLPTVNLYAKQGKNFNPKKTAAAMRRILPELK